jgi:hypothetical protein
VPRNIGAVMAGAIAGKFLAPVLLVDLAINSQVLHVWSGVGLFPWNGNGYVGVGDLGAVGMPEEGVDVNAGGASLVLSAVNAADLGDALSDVQLGAPGTIWLGIVNMQTLQLVDQPIVLFAGIVDAPTVQLGAEQGANGEPATGVITVPLESRLAMLGAGQQRKYSRADQALTHPDDRAFDSVSLLNYTALRWGN